MNKFYVTTAIDYPNGRPHIGHAYEKIISDVFARWHRFKGDKVFFSTGTDEHGQKLQKYAKEAGKEPKDYVDETVKVFLDLCEKLNISNDTFIRTTNTEHETLAQELFDKVLKKGDIYLGKYSGNYCIYDEAFFTDKDLVDGNCPTCGRPTELVEEDAYFFKMGKYQKQLIKYIEDNNYIKPVTRQNEILSRLKNDELRDLCVSRTSFSWGIPLLNDPKHVIYVWFDALSNYLSAIKYPNDDGLWPADVHVIGKDIIWFHTVIWPSMLMAAEIPLPKQVYAHGFILAKGGDKMSKSKGNSLEPMELIDKYGPDALRYYLCKVVPSADDGYVSEEDLVQRYNSELGNDLGNLVMRCVKLSLKSIGEEVLPSDNYSNVLKEIQENAFTKADHFLHKFEYDRALAEIWAYVKRINVYLNEKEPWKIKDELELRDVMYTALDNLSNAVAMLKPYVPGIAKKIESQLGVCVDLDNFYTAKTFKLKDEVALFPRIEWVEKIIMPLNLKVAEIKSVEPHPDADKLLVIKIDCGEERQIVAGLKEYYAIPDLVGKKIVVVTNLAPAKLRGVESQAMLLAAVNGNEVKVISSDLTIGSQVLIKGAEINKEQISFEEFKKIKLKVQNYEVFLNGKKIENVKSEIESGKVY